MNRPGPYRRRRGNDEADGDMTMHIHGSRRARPAAEAGAAGAFRILPAAVAALLLAFGGGCSKDPAAAARKHAERGDGYAGKGQYREAVIEYKNAVRSTPSDGGVRWKLAKSLLETRDVPDAYQELRKVSELDPSNLDAQERLAEILLASGKLEEADRIARQLVEKRPGSCGGYLLQAGIALRQGRTDEAFRRLNLASKAEPASARPMVAMGSLHQRNGNMAEALAWFERAAAAEPSSEETQLALARFQFAAGSPDEGVKAFRRAATLARDRESVRIALAQALFTADRLAEAEGELNSLVSETGSQRARKILAELKLEEGKADEARPIVEEILRKDGKDLTGKYLAGRLALASKKLEDAKKAFSEVSREDPANAKARLFNGVVDILQGREEAGRKEVEEAVKADPSYMRAHLVLGDLYLKGGYPEGAEREALEVLKRNRSSLAATMILGDSFLARKDHRRAGQVYGSIVRQLPRLGAGHHRMGLLRKAEGKHREAAEAFARARELDPKDRAALAEQLFALRASGQSGKAAAILAEEVARNGGDARIRELEGTFQMAEGRHAAAEAAFLKAIEIDPETVGPYYRLGVLYSVQKRLPEAEGRFRTVVEKERRNTAARTILGIVLNLQGKTDAANAEYRKVLEVSPRNPLAANNLAANLTDGGGNLDEALKFAQVAREAAPEDPYVADTLGWIYYRKGILSTAHSLLGEALRKEGRNPAMRYHMGMILSGMGKEAEAKGEFRQALAIATTFPGSDDARKRLGTAR